mgnify:FL=1
MQADKAALTRTAELTGRTRVHTTARWISSLFSPYVLILALLALISLRIGTVSGWIWAGISIFNGVLLPVLYIYIQLQRGRITDFDLRDRQQRIRPMLLFLILNFMNLLFMWLNGAPTPLVLFGETGIILLGILLLITLRWKISGHATAAACFAASVSGLFGGFAILTLLLPLAVSWSRVHMGRHDRAQVLAGTTLGFLFGSLYLVFLHIQEITL